MNYKKMRYKSLAGMKDGLLTMISGGQPYPDVFEQLNAINAEIAIRNFRLVGEWDGREVVEYDRFHSEEEARAEAENWGLPIGTTLIFGGHPFIAQIIPVED